MVSPEALTGPATCLQVARLARRVPALCGCAGPARARFRRQAGRVGPQGSCLESRRGGATRKARGRATFDAPAGDREISGCARGLFWLQKSTSGAGSTPSGMGLAPTPHAREGNLPARFCLVQRGFCFAQRGEEASWPARVTSSDALPVDLPEVQRPKAGRCRGPRGHPARGSSREAARSGIGWSVLGARGRKSVAEVGERHLSPSTLGASRRAGQRGDSLKRPARPLTRPAPDRGRRQGAGRAANVNNERDSPTRAARFGSIRWKASWFVRSPSS